MNPPATEAELDRTTAALVEYYGACEREEVDRLRFAGRHPDVAAALQAHWRLVDELRQLAAAACAAKADRAGRTGTPVAPGTRPLPAERIGCYRLEAEIGRGGMGVVYRARQPGLDRAVAVKVILAGALAGEGEIQRFHAEATAAARLRHEGIATIYEFGQHDGQHFLAMEWIDGANLKELLRQRGPLPPREAAQIVRDVARAVDHAHHAGVVHRDLKPSNILIDRQGQPRVTDFGLARTVDSASGLTLTGEAIGTPSFMPPEQAGGQHAQIGPAADVYSLGATLYALLIGRPPFEGASVLDTLWRVRHQAPPEPRRQRPDTPRDLATVVLTCLNKEPAGRYESAGALADELQRFLDGRPIQARPIHPLQRLWRWSKRQPAVAALLATLIVSLATGTGLSTYYAWRAEEQARAAELGRLVGESNLVRRTKASSIIEEVTVNAWSSRAWKLAAAAGQIRRDDRVRDAAAAALAGIDVVDPTRGNRAVSSLAIDPEGRWLLLGGTAAAGGELRDIHSGDLQATSSRLGAGAVAFFAGMPIQAVAAGSAVVLWDLQRQDVYAECRFPPPDNAAGALKIVANRAVSEDYPLMAVAPDAARIAAAAETGDGAAIVCVWNAPTGALVGTYPIAATRREAAPSPVPAAAGVWQSSDVSALALSPDGELLAIGTSGGEVLVCPLRTSHEVRRLTVARTQVHSLLFKRPLGVPPTATAADRGWHLVAGGSGGVLEELDLPSGSRAMSYRGAHWDVFALAVSPDGTVLASGGRETVLWDVATGQPLLRLAAGDNITGVAFSPDGRKLAVGSSQIFSWPGQHIVANVEYGRGIRPLRGLVRPVTKVRFSDDGRLLAALSQDWQVGVWDVATGRLRLILDAPEGVTADNAALAFNRDGTRLAFCAGTGARLWDTATGRAEHTWELRAGLFDSLAFDDAGRLLAFRAAKEGDSARPWVFRTTELRIPDPPVEICSVAGLKDLWRALVSVGAQRVLIVDYEDTPNGKSYTTEVYDYWTGEPAPHRGAQWPEYAESIDPQGEFASAVLADGSKVLLNLIDGSMRRLAVLPTAIGPAGALLASTSEGETTSSRPGCKLYRDNNPTPLVRLGMDELSSQSYPQFSADGRYLAWGNEDGTVELCDLPEVYGRLNRIGLGWDPGTARPSRDHR